VCISGLEEPKIADQPLWCFSLIKQLVEDGMDIVSLLIQLISGAAGGNIAGSLLKNLSLGTVGNSLAGIVGGGLGGQLLGGLLSGGAPAMGAGGLDMMSVLSQVAGGGIGGGGLMAIIGLIRSMMAK
jgi:hypothetical protein